MTTRLVLLIGVLAAISVAFLAASAWSIRVAVADYWFRKQTLSATEKAIALSPGQWEYWKRLALLEPDEDGTASFEALKHAVSLNPAGAEAWIELGLRYEAAGDPQSAERCLLRAAQEDRQYLPRWTLANYYFRANRIDSFWFWARQAAAMSYGDPAPLFRLCGRVTEDGALMERLEMVRPDATAAYLSYLLGQNRLDLILPVTRQLLKAPKASEIPLLLTACDRLLGAQDLDDALFIWNSLANERKIPFHPRPSPDGQLATNGDFRVAPTQQGFDWRVSSINGVNASADDSGGLRLTLSGGEPENCELLLQFLALRPNTGYELTVAYRTHDVAPASGLVWNVKDGASGKALVSAGVQASEGEVSKTVSFATPAESRCCRLTLDYLRSPGTTRITGYIVLRNVSVKAAAR